MKRVLLAVVLLFSLPAIAREESEPLATMSTCLIMYNWSAWGIWRFDVFALAGDKILIGEKDNHFLVTANEPGYAHVIAGEVVARYPDATSIADLGDACAENCPVNHRKRTGWFKRRCEKYPG